jgi:hypothetical protein
MTTTARLTIINTAWICLVIWAWIQGYVQRIMAADGAHMTLIIATVFVVGLVSAYWWARKADVATAKDASHSWGYFKAGILTRNTAHLYDIFAALFILGIVGNAIGFLAAFGGVDPHSMSSAEGMQKAGAQLLSGVGTAFGSTITGLTLALWFSMNLRVLATAIDRLRS